jgi:glycosyltransferase involved in cell wall biosynthesis
MLGVMAKPEQLSGLISLVSNSPYSATGYGTQAGYLVDRFVRHGLRTAVQSNYGLEGSFDKVRTPYGEAMHYPKGFKPYSDDVIQLWHDDWKKKNPGVKSALMTLYDVWVYDQLKFDDPIFAYVPIDHVTMPPLVHKFLLRENVTPVTMSLHGQRMLESRDIKSVYAPHSVDTTVFTPTHDVNGVPTREFMGVKDDQFLVSMFAANKSNGILHRKSVFENLMAFSIFKQTHKEAVLYLHMEGSKVFGGFNIPVITQALGLTDKDVIMANSTMLRVGYPQEQLAAFYTASDVVLNATMGEGFGVCSIEAQACGTRIITSNWTASQDLAGPDSYLCDGQPFWDEPQASVYQLPLIPSIANALELAYKEPRGVSLESIKFAKQYDVEKVWAKYWMPMLRDFYAHT